MPRNEYRKLQRRRKKAQEKERAEKAEEERQREEAWSQRSRRLTQARQDHPVKYFFGVTDAQQEIFGKVSVVNKFAGLGRVTQSNPTGQLGLLTQFVTTVLFLTLFFPLLLLSHPYQLPGLGIIASATLAIELRRYDKGTASKQEWKVVLGVLTAFSWVFFLLVLKQH